MNKQQLAKRIWESANKMRSNIEANDYKDYILGFIFYKFLSDQEEKKLSEDGWTEDDIKEYLKEDNTDVCQECLKSQGYFIPYEHLFSTWLSLKKDFDVSNVRDALSAFSRLTREPKNVFTDIFNTLETGLKKLGESAASQTKAISDLLELIKDIPMNGKQDYDMLGFIYEYLLANFAANAGKKAGEFYTPHEVSFLMSEIIAYHLRGKEQIEIYDPTSGSGSLLINIGQTAAKRGIAENKIKYYAQELKQNTYNLTRMNLIMRNINPSNIQVRNADTLDEDWPFSVIEEEVDGKKEKLSKPLYVDAVVSNPPYSQHWNPSDHLEDVRYKRFGIAPKSKADYAFLLHDLYHLKPNGMMAIVLPHGVLFRGNEEEAIRTQLIEENHVDAIIGLPANIFYGTSIPTIIMVLRQKREHTDVLIVDASQGFEKSGTANRLRASDIRRITDTVTLRQEVSGYSRLVSREEIRKNGYNLNIPRYIDNRSGHEAWDIYATMFGGIPKEELGRLSIYWEAFPGLQEKLFREKDEKYVELTASNVQKTIMGTESVTDFQRRYHEKMQNFPELMKQRLILPKLTVNVYKEQEVLANSLFERLQGISILDKYEAYQIFSYGWETIVSDLETLQIEGIKALRQVDPVMVLKKVKGQKDEVEVQVGWEGHLLPFALVQQEMLHDDKIALEEKNRRLDAIDEELAEMVDEMVTEDSGLLNDDNTAFVIKAVNSAFAEEAADLLRQRPDYKVLSKYMELLDRKAKKQEKLDFIKEHSDVDWSAIEPNKDGTYGKGKVKAYLQEMRAMLYFSPDSRGEKLSKVLNLDEEKKQLKSAISIDEEELSKKTRDTIRNLTDEEADALLEKKWLAEMIQKLNLMPEVMLKELKNKIEGLAAKYAKPLPQVSEEIHDSTSSLAEVLTDIEGGNHDMQGILKLQKMLRGM